MLEVHLEARQTIKTVITSKTAISLRPLTIFARSYILDLQLGSEYTSGCHRV